MISSMKKKTSPHMMPAMKVLPGQSTGTTTSVKWMKTSLTKQRSKGRYKGSSKLYKGDKNL